MEKGGDGAATLVKKGVSASPGLAVGRAFVIDRRRVKTPSTA